ncbi:unnamed protein product [Dracunculus medinensis]|uniref:Actin-related protein 5 n=1 Tax=Dracunculus medinensis TaxID=318479 RepID=A0A0N4U2L5_DRAME|nr:unnamed protein product [Dracunculus medinensis]
MRGRLFNNIILIGGNSLFAGYQRRLSLELRSHVDDIYNIGFRDVPNPITHAWQCGRDAFCANVSKDRFVTKEEYNEYGIDICIKRYFKFFED